MGGKFRAALIAGWLLALCAGGAAQAGSLVLVNSSNQPITCTVDGWTVASGAPSDQPVTIAPQASYWVGQNTSRQTPVINWATCGGLTTRAMNITPAGPNGRLVLNGQQARVLNVALYSYIPNPPGATFEALVNHVIATYQQQNPQVLLNAQMSTAAQNGTGTSIYSFADLPVLLQQGQVVNGAAAGGFDVMEIDTIFMGFLVGQNLLNPAQIAGDTPLPVALQASTFGGQLWGIPSWLCMDFIYSGSQAVRDAATLTQMLQALQALPQGRPRMVGTYNGSWRLPSMYINAYVHTYGYDQIGQAMAMPPDNTAIGNILRLTATCASNNANNCINGSHYSSTTRGVTEQIFAQRQASADMGFSEQSFYIGYYPTGPVVPLYAAPAPWGDQPVPLLFSDSFVTSRANCPANSQCAADADAFTTMMTGAAMKAYIVESQDLPNGSPWRTLLVATEPFYARPEIANNGLYQRITQVFLNAQAFPNTFTSQIKNDMRAQICTALKAQNPAYSC